MPSDADEVAQLKNMGLGRRPPWDGSPLRARPAALKGLQPITREPWAIDEDVYNRRFETRDVGIPGVRPCDTPQCSSCVYTYMLFIVCPVRGKTPRAIADAKDHARIE